MMDYLFIIALITIGGGCGATLALIFGWTVWISALIGAAIPALIIFGMFLMMLSLVAGMMSLGGNK